MTYPLPTTDIEQAKADLDRYGYCLAAHGIDRDRVRVLRGRLSQIAAQEVQARTDHVYSNGCNQRVWSLLNKDAAFVELAQDPLALELIEHLLGKQALLSNLSANIAGPGGSAMVPHWDQDFVPRPWPYPLMAHVLWMLDDFTEENGATLVVPGSHLTDHAPPAGDLIPALGPAGTALCFDARLWHGTGANATSDSRVGVLAYYCRMFVRQQENFFLSLDARVLEGADRGLLELLGYTPPHYIGMVNGPPREWPRY